MDAGKRTINDIFNGNRILETHAAQSLPTLHQNK
jgi:hypothetical protein